MDQGIQEMYFFKKPSWILSTVVLVLISSSPAVFAQESNSELLQKLEFLQQQIRFVLFFGHEFNDKTRFYSEFELEHSLVGDTGGGTPGEVELEQAFIEFDLRAGLHAKAGLFLLPIGILNETHEPPSFYGVERNDVESIIVPSTWWEAGAAINGRWGSDWNWDLALTSGLQMPTTGSNAFRVRSGRQKVAKAVASDVAITGRLRYIGIAGLQAALTVQNQFDPNQAANDGLDDVTHELPDQ
jgi:hypothetical protein